METLVSFMVNPVLDRALLHALLQTRLDKRVQIAVQHLLRRRRFVVGAQVLDAAVVEHIAANLVAPADIGLGVFELLLRFLLLAQLEVVEARTQPLPGDVAVAVLAAAVLALHDDAGGQVSQAHRRVGLVDVLAAGATGAEGIGAHVRRVDVDLD